MKRKGADGVGDYDDAFSPMPVSILILPPNSMCLLIMLTFIRSLYKVNCYPGTVTNEKAIFALYRVMKRILRYIYRLLKPLYGILSDDRAWHTMMSAFVEREGCEPVGFEKSMWRVVIDGHRIPLGAHINDFIIA